MPFTTRRICTCLAAAALIAGTCAHAQEAEKSDPRPGDATRNLPSDTGSQTTQPSGAVTGAGQPQGTLPQADYGAPGGAEQRAREQKQQEREGNASADRKATKRGADREKDPRPE